MTYAIQLFLLAALHASPATADAAISADVPAGATLVATPLLPSADHDFATESEVSDDDDRSSGDVPSEAASSGRVAVAHHDAPAWTPRRNAVAGHAPRGPPAA